MPEPRSYVPLDDDGQPDRDRVQVMLMQHKPGETQALVDWTGGVEDLANSAPIVILPGKGGVVGLGDYARLIGGRFVKEKADGLATRYTPADQLDDQEG